MEFLENRLKTFKKWPHPIATYPSPKSLAAAGFYYVGKKKTDDTVRCYLCEKELADWEVGDDPIVEHKKRRPDCPLFNLHSEASRTATFINWPHASNVHLSALAMAKAGFYFDPILNTKDTVVCYTCHCGLGDWAPLDNPWEEHRKRQPTCAVFQQSDPPKSKTIPKAAKRGRVQPNLETDIQKCTVRDVFDLDANDSSDEKKPAAAMKKLTPIKPYTLMQSSKKRPIEPTTADALDTRHLNILSDEIDETINTTGDNKKKISRKKAKLDTKVITAACKTSSPQKEQTVDNATVSENIEIVATKIENVKETSIPKRRARPCKNEKDTSNALELTVDHSVITDQKTQYIAPLASDLPPKKGARTITKKKGVVMTDQSALPETNPINVTDENANSNTLDDKRYSKTPNEISAMKVADLKTLSSRRSSESVLPIKVDCSPNKISKPAAKKNVATSLKNKKKETTAKQSIAGTTNQAIETLVDANPMHTESPKDKKRERNPQEKDTIKEIAVNSFAQVKQSRNSRSRASLEFSPNQINSSPALLRKTTDAERSRTSESTNLEKTRKLKETNALQENDKELVQLAKDAALASQRKKNVLELIELSGFHPNDAEKTVERVFRELGAKQLAAFREHAREMIDSFVKIAQNTREKLESS